MSCRDYSTPLRHHYGPNPHPEIASFPLPLKRAYGDKKYFVVPSCAEERAFDELGQGETLETAKPLPETSLEWPSTSVSHSSKSYPQRFKHRAEYRDFNTFPCRPFVACCCGYSCCGLPNVCQQSFGPSHRRDSAPNSGYYVRALDNILLPNGFVRMAYERERCDHGGTTENHDQSFARKRTATSLVGVCGEKNGNEARNSNLKFDVARTRQAPSTDFKMGKGAFQTDQESSKQKRKLEAFCESETHDVRKEKRFREEPDSTQSFCEKVTDHVDYKSWQNFRPVVYIEKRINPSQKMDPNSKPNGFLVDDSQNEIGAFELQGKESVSSTEYCYHQSQTLASRGSEDAELSSHDTRVGEAEMRCHLDPPASRFPSYEISKLRGSSTNEAGGFISLDSTKSAFLTSMSRMRNQQNPDVMPCPYCSRTFVQYADLKTHVQTHQDGRASVDNAPEMKGGDKIAQSPSGAPVQPPAEDDASKRATSVIMFAGQRNDVQD